MKTDQEIISELIAEAKEDQVGLWLIISILEEEFDIVDREVMRARTLDVSRSLLESGIVVAGSYKPDGSGIEPWRLQIPEIVSRIDHEWDELGHEPNIGDIVVFVGRDHDTCNVA